MKIQEEARREGGDEQNVKEEHIGNTVHCHKSAIRSTGVSGYEVKIG